MKKKKEEEGKKKKKKLRHENPQANIPEPLVEDPDLTLDPYNSTPPVASSSFPTLVSTTL